MRFARDMLEQLPPPGLTERRHPFRSALVHFHDEHPADADALHRLQVRGDAIAGDVTVEPEPINPRPGGRGRVGEPLFQLQVTIGGMADTGQ